MAFAIDLDTLELFPPVGEAPLDAGAVPDVREIVERIDDGVLDAIARLWHRGKGEQPPPEPGADGAKIQIEGWSPGELVAWHDAQPSLRRDTYVFGDRLFEAVELYCVKAGCDCGTVIVDFDASVPGAVPYPGHVELAGGVVTLHPEQEPHGEHLDDLWAAYCARYPRYQERFARRSATMRGLAGRIVATPKPKVGRNALCPCGSGKKLKKCCGAA